MSKRKDGGELLSGDELREAWDTLKEYALSTPEQARAFFDELGGLKKVTVDLYEALLREQATLIEQSNCWPTSSFARVIRDLK